MTFFFLQNLPLIHEAEMVTLLPGRLDHGGVQLTRFTHHKRLEIKVWARDCYEVQPFSTVIDAKPLAEISCFIIRITN
jgi:hypothetical protein